MCDADKDGGMAAAALPGGVCFEVPKCERNTSSGIILSILRPARVTPPCVSTRTRFALAVAAQYVCGS